MIPRDDAPVSSLRRALFRYVPPLRWRVRATQMDFRESFYSAVTDTDSAFAEQIRTWCTDAMKQQLPNQPELWQRLTPNYSPGCKRVISSDDYYPALGQANCVLETRPITRITSSGIEVEDGDGGGRDSTAFDLIVLATGFRTIEFMHPIRVTGRHGRALSDIWAGGARALYGTTVEDLPNFGMFYGPNTNLGHNSIVLMIEAQSRYLNALVRRVLDARAGAGTGPLALVPRKERLERFNEEVQRVLNASSFADPKCVSWYKTVGGRITNNWSGTVVEYQEMLAKVDWADFEALGKGSGVVFRQKETKLGRVVEETRVSNMTLALSAAGVLAVAGGILLRGRRG